MKKIFTIAAVAALATLAACSNEASENVEVPADEAAAATATADVQLNDDGSVNTEAADAADAGAAVAPVGQQHQL